jgi:hypothetical protein
MDCVCEARGRDKQCDTLVGNLKGRGRLVDDNIKLDLKEREY